MKRTVDLHTHSNKSDGTLSPRELAKKAKEAGLSAIALTDHDTNNGVAEFTEECEKLGIEGIPGIEISTNFKRLMHIVGLYPHGDRYETVVEKLKAARLERNVKMLEKIHDRFDITSEQVLEGTGASKESCGRLHMANALVKFGHVKTVSDAFEKYLKRGRPCYVEKFSLSPEESVRLIKDCGGIAIWAHPVQAIDTESDMLEMAKKLKEAGLDAMECMYNNFTPDESRLCRSVAKRVGLLESGGSDFHGSNKPAVSLGRVSEGTVPYEILEQLKTRI
ncbi:MAG: PHP domain-containing protein [Oscillospiraceae bacterium]|nr:PHP domain-containing protein [Oscillospiraceae bacterium]